MNVMKGSSVRSPLGSSPRIRSRLRVDLGIKAQFKGYIGQNRQMKAAFDATFSPEVCQVFFERTCHLLELCYRKMPRMYRYLIELGVDDVALAA